MIAATAKAQVGLGFTLENLKKDSAKLNEMKQEIEFVFNVVLGVLKPGDCEGHQADYPFTFVRFETETLEWHGFLFNGKFEMGIWDCGNPAAIYSFQYGSVSSIPMEFIKQIHGGLDTFLAQIASDYPVVIDRTRSLLSAAVS